MGSSSKCTFILIASETSACLHSRPSYTSCSRISDNSNFSNSDTFDFHATLFEMQPHFNSLYIFAVYSLDRLLINLMQQLEAKGLVTPFHA